MAKLYPPQLEGTIPAFCGTSLTVPFVMNKTVGWNQINDFHLIIKSIQNNSVIYDAKSISYNKEKYEAYFNIVFENDIENEEEKLAKQKEEFDKHFVLGNSYNLLRK